MFLPFLLIAHSFLFVGSSPDFYRSAKRQSRKKSSSLKIVEHVVQEYFTEHDLVCSGMGYALASSAQVQAESQCFVHERFHGCATEMREASEVVVDIPAIMGARNLDNSPANSRLASTV